MIEVGTGRNIPDFPAFLEEPEHGLAAVMREAGQREPGNRTDGLGGVDENRKDGTVEQTGEIIAADRRQQGPLLVDRDLRRLAFCEAETFAPDR